MKTFEEFSKECEKINAKISYNDVVSKFYTELQEELGWSDEAFELIYEMATENFNDEYVCHDENLEAITRVSNFLKKYNVIVLKKILDASVEI